MLRYVLDENNHFVVIKTQPCDPNVLGIISDFLLQVDKIYTCVVFNEVSGGFKLSVRSCIREVNAGELAGFLTKDIGSGGGHYKKAGGFISRKLYEDKVGNANTEGYFINRMTEYFNYYELIYADSYKVNENELKIYQKVNVPVGYVKASDVLPVESPITVRTMEGDMDLVISDDLYIMIGIKGEVYPINEDKFKATYSVLDEKYNYDRYVIDIDYIPTMISRADGNKYKLEGYAGVCISTGESRIYAKELSKGSKVFTSWDKNRYMLGKPGDFLAVRMDDLHDMYIVDKTVFEKTYRLV